MNTGHIKLKGPIPPPSGLLYPSGRKTAFHVYQIFNREGRKIMGGSCGPDPSAALAYVKSLAAAKDLPDATVEIVPG